MVGNDNANKQRNDQRGNNTGCPAQQQYNRAEKLDHNHQEADKPGQMYHICKVLHSVRKTHAAEKPQ